MEDDNAVAPLNQIEGDVQDFDISDETLQDIMKTYNKYIAEKESDFGISDETLQDIMKHYNKYSDEKEKEINDEALQGMMDNFNKLSLENEKRRLDIEQDFENIKTRLETNKQALANVKTQIEKVTGILSRIKEYNNESIKLGIGDWQNETVMDKTLKRTDERDNLMAESKSELANIESNVTETLQQFGNAFENEM